MSGILRIEARHLARSPLLWLAFALAAWTIANELSGYVPALTGDDLLVYRSGFLGAAGAVWAGAWLGLRDRVSGAADLVTVTPTAPWRLWRARLAGVAVVAAGAYAVLFAGVLAVSAPRGGRGTPDLRMLADGALALVLSGLVGVAVGRLSGSRVVALLAGPVWSVLCMVAADPVTGAHRLSPFLTQTEPPSAEFGFLPDPFWPRLGYLLGLVLLAGVLLLTLAARGGGQRPLLAPMLVVAVAGLVLVGAGGARLVALPVAVVPLGPDRADWKPGPEANMILEDPSYAYPDDGRATNCAGDAPSVCVYPAYGTGLARHVHQAVQPVAGLFSGLPGVPTRVRMVPVEGTFCHGGEVQLGEQDLRFRQPSRALAAIYLTCVLGQSGTAEPFDDTADDARDAVRLWALLATGAVTGQELQRASDNDLWQLGLPGDRPPPALAPARAMAALPVDRVRAELGPLWERLRAGTLPVSELPGQRP
jgi:hypothetical protein